ncbi:hypothetical protein GCM10022267_44820 [Lentzea roselyniae]|uniref:Uncharacterized protein n=1 Tax=Lentzea roselyniae TaxID=531940 RepID=A0ABP7BBL0_9PSEU
MASIESAVIRVVVDVSDQLSKRLVSTRYRGRAPFPTQETEELLQDLGTEADKLSAYLDSPDFAAVVTQVRVQRAAGAEVEEQLHQGLRLAGLSGDLLTRTTGAVHRLLLAACDEVVSWYSTHGVVVDENDLLAAATATGRLLGRLRSVAEFHGFAARMRSQVTALHNKIRLPHLGVSRAARYDELYVPPTLAATKTPNPGATHRTAEELWTALLPHINQWEVVAQIALQLYDRNVEDGVDELLTEAVQPDGLNFAARALRHMHPSTRVVRLITKAALLTTLEYPITKRALYRPADLMFVDGALFSCMYFAAPANVPRRRVVALVEGFAHLHPLVPILVTARKIGYDEAPLIGQADRTDEAVAVSDVERGHAELLNDVPQRSGVVAGADCAPGCVPAQFGHAVLVPGQQPRPSFSPPLVIPGWVAGVVLQKLRRRFVSVFDLVAEQFHDGLRHGKELLGQETTLVDTASRDAVASAITECATPWANVTDFAFLSVTKIQQNPKKTDALAVMLALPFAELLFHDNVSTQWTPVPAALMAGRRNWRGKSEALRWLERASFPPEVDTFLKNWLAGSVSVTRPAPATPRRSRAPR